MLLSPISRLAPCTAALFVGMLIVTAGCGTEVPYGEDAGVAAADSEAADSDAPGTDAAEGNAAGDSSGAQAATPGQTKGDQAATAPPGDAAHPAMGGRESPPDEAAPLAGDAAAAAAASPPTADPLADPNGSDPPAAADTAAAEAASADERFRRRFGSPRPRPSLSYEEVFSAPAATPSQAEPAEPRGEPAAVPA
ncbi:MAG: hypothetical protein AAF790_15215, partial [Planctomycetota bacterium]